MRRLKELLAYQKGGPVSDGAYNDYNKMDIAGRKQYIHNWLLRKGYNDVQAASILGNLIQENSTLDTRVVNSIGAKGIAQWYKGRRNSLEKNYTNPDHIDNQLDFLHKEITDNFGGAWAKKDKERNTFFTTDNVQLATQAFRKGFERPGEHEAHDHKRINYAMQTLNKDYKGKGQYAPQPTTTDNTQVSSSPEAVQGYSVPTDMTALKFDFEFANKLSNSGFQEYVKSSNFNENIKKDLIEQRRLSEEAAKQARIKAEMEEANKRIAAELQARQSERTQALRMMPQSTLVSGNYANRELQNVLQQNTQNISQILS